MNTIKNYTFKLAVIIVLFLNNYYPVKAQDKISPKLRLSYVKHMGGAYEIKAHAYTKKKGQVEHCGGAGIGFYTDVNHEKLFKKLQTNDMGQAVLLLDEQHINQFKDSSGHYNFYARVEEDSKYEAEEADVSVLDAAIDVNFKRESDTVKLLEASVLSYDPAAKKMIPGVKIPLKCFVQRALCLLPVGKDLNFTDESGKMELAFPNDIPGDKDGNLIVIVKIDDDVNYGTVQYEKSVNWGTPLLNPSNPLAHRSLIGPTSNAPWFMVIGISAILIGVWGYISYIVYGLFRIRKLGKVSTPGA